MPPRGPSLAPVAPEPVRLVHTDRRVFWHASVMTTGTSISVVTGAIDDGGQPLRARASATTQRFGSREETLAAFARLTAAARDDGFIDPLDQLPEPPRTTPEQLARLEATIARLRAHVEGSAVLELAGGVARPEATHRTPDRLTTCGPAGPSWALPPTYRAFLGRYAELTVSSREHVLLRLLDAVAAVSFTEDLESALVDHRPGAWPGDDLSSYGLDRCVVFALEDGWMEGWAFDTRVAAHGELAIRRIHDFSVDAKAMEAAWPHATRTADSRPTPFLDWLDDRVTALIAKA